MFEPPLTPNGRSGSMGTMSRTHVRRRRTFAVGLALMVAVALMGPVAGAVTRSAEGAHADATYVVRSGDTLWDVAQQVAPRQDPRVVVQLLEDANRVDAGSLVPGQTLVIPRIG